MGPENARSPSLDVLFLHVPKFRNYSRPIGDFSFILYPPIGLLGLADYLARNGHPARIVHLGVEQRLHGSVSLERILARYRPAVIGLDLHWHFQSFDVIEVARKIKSLRPDLPIVLGGFTASLFATEILRDYPCIDFIVRGDAEIPLLALARAVRSGRAVDGIPNLSWRDGPRPVHNPQSFVADAAFLDGLCFTDFSLLEDYSVFIRSFSRLVHLTGVSDRLQRLLFARHSSYPVYLGRGCYQNCSFCGGSCEAQSLIAGRQRIDLRSVSAVVSSIQDLARYGFDYACFVHDLYLPGQADETYAAIFDELVRLQVPIRLEVERSFLPGARFMQSFTRLPRGSFVTLSPYTHNEKLRAANGLSHYSNAALDDCLRALEAHGIPAVICFSCGLPFETRDDLRAMAAWQKSLQRRFRNIRFKTSMIEIEPGSRMSRVPDKYGLRLERTTLADYYRYHSDPKRNHWYEMGYRRHACPAHGEVSSFFCAHFCERFRAGRLSPALCSGVAALRGAGAFRVLDKAINLLP